MDNACAAAKKVDAVSAMFLVGSESDLPKFEGTVYLADAATCGEYNPDVHKQLLLETIDKVKPENIAVVARLAEALHGENRSIVKRGENAVIAKKPSWESSTFNLMIGESVSLFISPNG